MQEKHLYEYAVIRYVPRVEREEFINIGLIMMCKRRKWLRVAHQLDLDKLDAFCAPHPAADIERQMLTFDMLADGDPAGGPMAKLPVEERFRWLTAMKSACIQTSRPHPGKTDNLDKTFARLYSDLVE